MEEFKGHKLFDEFMENNESFRSLIDTGMQNGLIRKFDDREYALMTEQNFMGPMPGIDSLYDICKMGLNVGSCAYMARQFSFSYDNVDIVAGILPMIKGTLNAEKEGGHVWLETEDEIIDTTFLLVINKSLKDLIGYIEEERRTQFDLRTDDRYMSRKEFVRDPSLKKSK